MRYKLHIIAALGLAMLLSGCGDANSPVSEPDCSQASRGDARVTGRASITSPTARPARENLVIAGTASHKDGLAIRSIRVGDTTAEQTDEAFNFSDWIAEVPLESLLARENRDEDGVVDLDVAAFDACGRRYVIDRLSVEVAPAPEAPSVTSLDVTVSYPSAASYIPATRAVAAVLSVKANAEAAGSTVEVTTTHGRFSSTGDITAQVPLVATGNETAVGLVDLTAETAGTATISARAGNVLTTNSVNIVGTPVLAPSAAELAPGSSLRVEILTGGGTLASTSPCSVELDGGVEVSSGDRDLSAGDAPVDTNSNGAPDFMVAVDAAAESGDRARVVCEDVYGQQGVGLYDVTSP
ncbi:MAG: hypothetical protein ACQEVA_06605 [Myxococcota bacterium]